LAAALGAAALPHLGPAGRRLALAAIPAVGLTRVYVGAHLPLDVIGGAALGVAVDAALTLHRQGRAGTNAAAGGTFGCCGARPEGEGLD
jgi:membrane-associated phospholipid phosphatase